AMAKALHLGTAQLPEVEIEKPGSIIQDTTIGSIRSGIFFGFLALAEGLIARFREEAGNGPTVVATGGFAALIAENTDGIDILDENLLLEGLRILNRRMQNA